MSNTYFIMLLIDSIQNFVTYLRINRNSSLKTVEQYIFHLWKFVCYLNPDITWEYNYKQVFLKFQNDKLEIIKKNKILKILRENIDFEIEDISIELINDFRFYLSEKDRNIKTVNAYMISLRTFFKYIKKTWHKTLDPMMIDLIKQKWRMVEFLTKEELNRLFEIPNTDKENWKRDVAIMECIYSTWLRISELVALNIQDINLDRKEFAIRWKWWKVRIVYLTDIAVEKIKNYIEARKDHLSPLFIRHNFNNKDISKLKDEKVRLTRFFITNKIKFYALKAWILKNVSAHTLRHSFATTLLENWADLRSIQELLWHSSITTTQVYTHVTNPKLKDVHNKYHK